jgi:hypothetical protein
MPDSEDIAQEAKDHGKLIDEEVARVENEAEKAAGGQDHELIDKVAEGVEKKVDGEQGNETSGQ